MSQSVSTALRSLWLGLEKNWSFCGRSEVENLFGLLSSFGRVAFFFCVKTIGSSAGVPRRVGPGPYKAGTTSSGADSALPPFSAARKKAAPLVFVFLLI